MILKIFYWVVSIVAVYLVFEIGLFIYKVNHLPVLPKPDTADKTFGQGSTLRYVVAGDSVAVGYGASFPDKSFAQKILQYLGKTHTVEYKNVAVIGNKTSDVINNQLDQIISFKPDIIVISITANDATHLVSSETIINNYKQIINTLQEKTSAKIYITNVPDFSNANLLPLLYIKILEYRSVKLNQKLLALENERVKIVNIHDFGWASYPDLSKTFAADHFHPNDLGYENWTNAFLDKIKKDF